MKKKIVGCFLVILFAFFLGQAKSYAVDLDEITNYVVTVEPRMNDGTLDITYEITWKVLDSTTEGPLEWVQIGTPNSYFDTPTALSKNIKRISAYNGPYVRIDFTKQYHSGEELTFKYKIHQSHMYQLSSRKCKFSFTPAWFPNAKVDLITIKWNKDQVKSSNTRKKQESYLIWEKANLSKGEKLTAKIEYKKDAFGYLNETKQMQNLNDGSFKLTLVAIILIIVFIRCLPFMGGGGYYGHRGFGGGYYGGYYSSCVHSSCACAHSSCASSCACACAGSGRAGCSKKDFYGTKINKKKLKVANFS